MLDHKASQGRGAPSDKDVQAAASERSAPTCDTGPPCARASLPLLPPPAAQSHRQPSMPPDRTRPSPSQVTLVTHLG